MPKRLQPFALLLALSSLPVFASGPAGSHPYESCLTAKAFELEGTGVAVDQVIAEAERFCSGTRGQMTSAELDAVSQKVRLAVMQQRSNARNTLRRG